MDIYINKWWGNYIGGSDDALLLLDYFGTNKKQEISLNEILEDIKLNNLLKLNSFEEGDLFFEIENNYVPHFDMATNVLIDLSTILLESLKNGNVTINNLDEYSKYDKTFSIHTTKEDIKNLKNSLDYFIVNANSFEIAEFMAEKDFNDFISDCKEVSNELSVYC